MKAERALWARFHVLAAILVVSCGYAASAYATDDGTRLSVSASVDAVSCNGAVAVATINVTVVSTGSTAPAALYVSIDLSTFTSVGTIVDWTGTGRTKIAEGAIQVTVPIGVSEVEVRAVQPGTNGARRKAASSDLMNIDASCGG